MSKDHCDLYLIGVGGQGIGLLSETMVRAADAAGLPVRGVDTHGLAQRGGTVTSHVRIGSRAHSPLIKAHQADMVVSLERHEALRGLNSHLKDGGTLIYFDCEFQPLGVRLGKAKAVRSEFISQECHARNIRVIRVSEHDIPDPRMQNIALMAFIAKLGLISGIGPGHFEQALTDILDDRLLAMNLDLFRKLVTC